MKFIKYLLITLTIFLTLMVLSFYYLVDKANISKYIYKQTNIQTSFDKYGISLYPTLALKLSNLKYDDGKFAKIYSKKLLIAFEFNGMESIKNPKVKALYLVEPDITIYTQESSKNKKEKNKLIDIKNIYLKNATLSYENHKVQNINLGASLEHSILHIKELNILKYKGINEINISGKIDLSKEKQQFDLSIFFKKSDIKEVAKNFNIKLPEIKDKNTLKNISIFTKVKGDISKIYIKETKIEFDDTTVSFKAIVNDLNLQTMVSVLNINQIDLNRYVDIDEDDNTTKSKNSVNINYYLGLLKNVKHMSKVKIKNLKIKKLSISDIFFKLKINNNIIDVDPISLKLYDGKLQGQYQIDISKKEPKIKVKQKIANLELSKLFNQEEKIIEGKVNLLANVIFEGTTQKDILNSVSGLKMLYGKNLVFNKYNVDKILTQYEKTKKIDLVDIGAMLIIGPFAGLLTQSVKFTMLKNEVDTVGKTQIKEFSSLWQIKNQKAVAKDVAIKTSKNIIALKGEIDLKMKKFNKIQIAVLDKKGCAKYIQTFSGNLNTSEIKVKENAVEIFFSPIATVFKNTKKLVKECKVFYTGKVKWD